MIGLGYALLAGALGGLIGDALDKKGTTETNTTTTTTTTNNTLTATNCNNKVIYNTRIIVVKKSAPVKKSRVDVLLRQGFNVVGFYNGKHLLWNGKKLIIAKKKNSITYIPNKPEFRNTPVAYLYNQLMQKKQKQLTCSSNHSAKPKQIANKSHQQDRKLLPPVKKKMF